MPLIAVAPVVASPARRFRVAPPPYRTPGDPPCALAPCPLWQGMPAWLACEIAGRDALADEEPASDAQTRYLSYLGAGDRYCSRDEASALIGRIKRAMAKAAVASRKAGAVA